MVKIRIGCSGWDYDDWKGVFYEPAVRSKLQAYAKVFDTAEINATFYHMPDEGVVQGWARYSPEGFLFAAKVPQEVTHQGKLVGNRKVLDEFLQRMEPLRDAGKLGPLLLQLPPSLRFDAAKVSPFLEGLPPGYHFAVEPREPSWLKAEAVSAVRKAGVALVCVDEPLLPPDVHVTADFAYFRWHGHGKKPWYNYHYSKEELSPWVPRIEGVCEQVPRAFGYFNNHYHGYGPKNALELTEMMAKLTPEQRQALSRLDRAVATKVARRGTLDPFIPQGGLVAREVEILLTKITDAGRLERAKEIPSADLALSKVEPSFVRADVHGTRVVLDLAEQVVRHNCPDYLKGMREKRVCKHIARLLLELPPEFAREFADDLMKSKAQWTFEEFWGRDD